MGYIKDVKLNNTTYLIEPTLFTTATGTAAAITANIANFTLVSGITIYLKIITANAAAATLNVNNTGAKSLIYNNLTLPANVLKVGQTYTLCYDGNYWQIAGHVNLGTAAFTDATDYATAAQGALADAAMPRSGGIFTGAVTLAANPSNNLEPATKQYVDSNVSISNTLSTGTPISTITIGNTPTTLYAPTAPTTIDVIQTSSSPTLEFVVGTNSGVSASLTGVLSDTTTITNGKLIYFLSPYALPESTVTLELSYANTGNTTGAIPIYAYGTVRSIAAYPAGSILILLYYNSAFYLVNNTSAVVGGSTQSNVTYQNGDEVEY